MGKVTHDLLPPQFPNEQARARNISYPPRVFKGNLVRSEVGDCTLPASLPRLTSLITGLCARRYKTLDLVRSRYERTCSSDLNTFICAVHIYGTLCFCITFNSVANTKSHIQMNCPCRIGGQKMCGITSWSNYLPTNCLPLLLDPSCLLEIKTPSAGFFRGGYPVIFDPLSRLPLFALSTLE